MHKFLLLFFLVIVSASSKSQSKVYENILYYYKDKNFSGTILIAKDGKIIFSNSVGEADKTNKIKITNTSKYKIASITKAFTATLIMKLVQEGSIQLDKPIADYYKAYKGPGSDKVTIHDLLTYSSGIENMAEPLEMQSYQIKLSLDDYINKYCSGALVSKPGTQSNYSNTEYILLHKIIESVTGKQYEAYLDEVILKPLNMRNTALCSTTSIIPGLAKGYTYSDSLHTFYNDVPYYIENFFGSGALYSTAQDLLTFDQALFSNKILDAATTAKMLSIHENLGYTAYGFWGSTGWGNFTEPFYYRTGGIQGFTSNWIHTMDTKTTIIALANNNAVNLYEMSEQFYLASLGKPLGITIK